MILYYVHHHGSGHAHRAASVAAHLRSAVVGVGSRDAPAGWPGEWVRLPPDTDDGVDPHGADVTAHGTLHWVPRHHDGLRDRMATISALLRELSVRAVVCDVSVEVALLARLHGVPVAVMAQPGRRLDRPHRTAYDLADVLLAPWPQRPARPGWPAAWRRRTVHLGGLSRYDDRSPTDPPGRRRVLVLSGSGGDGVDLGRAAAAAGATPDWTWRVAGTGRAAAPDPTAPDRTALDPTALEPTAPDRTAPIPTALEPTALDPTAPNPTAPGPTAQEPTAQEPTAQEPTAQEPTALDRTAPNLTAGGWTGDVWTELQDADVVVGHAGQNVVAEIAAARRPAVIVPEPRPFGEQDATAQVLARAGLATVLPRWPEPDAWPRLLAGAVGTGGRRWSSWSDGTAAARAADAIDGLAGA